MAMRHVLALCWIALASAASPAFGQYQAVPASIDGIGIAYMGREIAHVMGHEGADWLERPERAEEEQPDRVLDIMRLAPTDVVADIGAGTGYFSLRLADRLPRGAVIAEDVQPEMIDLLREAMATRGARNVQLILGATDDPHLPAGAVDKVLMVDAYHEFDKPLEMMRGVLRGLKPDGEVVFVEYRGEDPAVPIKPLHKMTEAQLSTEMAAIGLRLKRRDETLPWQHVLIYSRP